MSHARKITATTRRAAPDCIDVHAVPAASNPVRRALAAFGASALCVAGASAQTTTDLDAVTVTGRADPVTEIGGWAGVPLSKSPFSAAVVGTAQWRDLGGQRLADLTRLNPAVSDAYDAEGYWDQVAVRGYTLDNRYNYRRDGLPINAETSIPLDNKERIELLLGTSGLQAGTSAPGGLLNLVVKRPGDAPMRDALLQWRQPGSVLGAVDVGDRAGTGGAFGWRVNAAAERIDPQLRDARGERRLLSVAGDWRTAPGALLEVEAETSHRSQPSQPGFSLLGATLPSARSVDPRTNLNDQPWSQPVVLDGDTASLRWTQSLAGTWRLLAHAMTQHLHSDDRLAYPYGCGKEDASDRYCSDGSYDLYDYRSDGERRRQDAAQLEVQGSLATGSLVHALAFGALRSRARDRFHDAANNLVGSGNIEGTAVTPADPSLTDPGVNRDERSTEVFARDSIRLGDAATAWLGARHTRLHRASVQTDGSEPTAFDQSFTTPWLALSYTLQPATTVYASWGRGVESDVAPNRPRYANAGQGLPSALSRQWEIGLKYRAAAAGASLAWFDIVRPLYGDLGPACADDSTPGACRRGLDGTDRHRGIDADADVVLGAWSARVGLQLLQARRAGSADPSLDGKRPTNVPARTLTLQAAYDVAAVPGLALQAHALVDGNRMVLEDNSLAIGGHAQIDAGLRYATAAPAGSARFVWRAGVDNVLDRRAWRESPLEYGHVYLYPMAPRTYRLSLEATI